MGLFIKIEVNPDQIDTETTTKITSLCPVDIFVRNNERLEVHPDYEDECTLCELCLDAAPAGALTIHKIYKDEALVSRGTR